MPITRRQFVRGTFLGGIALGIAGGVAGVVNYLFPRRDNVAEYVRIPPSAIPRPGGDPVLNDRLGFYLVNLTAAEIERRHPTGQIGAGLFAFSTVCPHLASHECPVRWSAERDFPTPFGGVDTGFFECPCHGSIFTKAGVRVFGPAPHSLDTLRIEPDKDNQIRVFVADVTEAGADGGARAFTWP